VLTQLPSRTDTVIPVAITEPQAARHAELDLPIAQLVGRARKRPLTPGEFLRLMSLLTTQRIIANGMAQLEFEEVWPALATRKRVDEAALAELSTPKLSHLREILEQVVVQQGRKAVVFSQWRRMLTLAHWAVGDVLASAGLSAAFFTGQESAKRRTQNIVDFHDEPGTAVLFSTDAGGVGLNLQHAASCCVNIDLPWNPAVLEQRIGRIYRMGQKRPIDVYNLVTESSIEARIAGLVADKKAFFSGLFDGDSNEVRFEHSSSFLSRLERIVEPARVPERKADERSPEDVASCEREVDALLARGDEEGAPSAEEAPVAIATATEAATAIGAAAGPGAWLAQLHIRRREDGGLHIDAPREAAEGLAVLFEGMGRLLREAARGSNG
jgi:SNF2 family DNA or RNA helicase